MNPAYGTPPVGGYGQPPGGHPPAPGPGYGLPPQRAFPPGPGPLQHPAGQPGPAPHMMQPQPTGQPATGYPQFPANGPSPHPPMPQGPPQGHPMMGRPGPAPNGPSSAVPPAGPPSGPLVGPPSGPPGLPAGAGRGPASGLGQGGGLATGFPVGGPPAQGTPPKPAPSPLMPGQHQFAAPHQAHAPPTAQPQPGPPQGLPQGPPQGHQGFPQGLPHGSPSHLADHVAAMNLGSGAAPRQGGPPPSGGQAPPANLASPFSPQHVPAQPGQPRPIPGSFPPPAVNGGGLVHGAPPLDVQPSPQDVQSPWMPGLQSPSHVGRPGQQQQQQQQSPYMNGVPGQPLSGLGRGPAMPPMGPGGATNGPAGYGVAGGAPPLPGPYPPQPGMGHSSGPQQPGVGVPGSHMNKGYPPGPGLQSPTQYAAPQGMYPAQQQKQQKRLDPAHMPSQIQVMEEDQKNNGGIFATCQKGRAPPLVTTEFIVQDTGYCSPRFIRASMYNVPTTMDMMKQTKLPLSLIISPMAELKQQEGPPPVVDLGEMGPVRCIRCKAYMCPFMQFVDGGRRFHCLFCKATTEVPPDYFQHLDHTGMRVDRFERPELVLGAYEFVATKEYCRNNTIPKPPALIFCIDVSYNNIKSGMVHLLCSRVKELLKLLPVDSAVNDQRTKMRVGFITYNNTVHFYNIKGCLAQPQMMVVGDVQEMFMPLLDGFLCDPEESASVIDALMEQIPAMFGETRETETVLVPAIQAGMEALKAAECAGKLLVFHSSLPIAEAPGKLKNRDDRKLLGTEKEKTVLTPQNNAYNNLGQECVAVGCSVDLFIFNNSYIDIATIGQVARLTGGEVYKYTYFQADIDGERLIADLRRNISRPIAFDAVMRVRTSTGVRATDFYGHFFMSNTTDMELASVDCDKGVAVEVKHDDKLTEDDGVYIQVALLYTSCGGQRRLRVLNLGLKTCSQMADVFRTCDLDTIVNFFSKLACHRLLEHAPKQVKDGLINLCAQILACYRKNVASPSSAGQLILPETMKLLPLYLNCLLKNDALSGGSDMTIDDRSFAMQAVMTFDVPSSVVYFYPRLLPLHTVRADDDIPYPVRCSIENMEDSGVYLLENGIHMFMWIGLAVSPEWLQAVFGVASPTQIDVERPFLPELDTPLSHKVRSIVSDARSKRHRCMRLTLVRQRDKMEMVMKHFLAEDRGVDGSSSYVDFLCHLHKEIRNLLE